MVNELNSYARGKRSRRKPGALAGRISMADDFGAWPKDVARGLGAHAGGHPGEVTEDTPERDDSLVRREVEGAEAEAARLGGRSGMEGMDEAQRSVAEHGGGESEGFEEAEELLADQAEHGTPAVDPLADAAEEAEEDEAVYGEADELESTETRADTEGNRHEG